MDLDRLWSLMDALQSVLKFCKQFKSGPLGNNAFLFFLFLLDPREHSFFFKKKKKKFFCRLTDSRPSANNLSYTPCWCQLHTAYVKLQVHLGDPKEAFIVYYSSVALNFPWHVARRVGLGPVEFQL